MARPRLAHDIWVKLFVLSNSGGNFGVFAFRAGLGGISGLNALAIVVDGVERLPRLTARMSSLEPDIAARLASGPESEMPEIGAWREAYTKMGLKATQYRCASDSLIRRFRKDQSMPSFHPLVDYLNYASMRFGIPIAAFDVDRVEDRIVVQEADGSEDYLTFQGDSETPSRGEIIFKDDDNNAHSRRWTFRQSARSVISVKTKRALLVSEAMHAEGARDLSALADEIKDALTAAGASIVASHLLGSSDRTLAF